MNTDEKYMKLALDLAELGRGKVSPNPMVACVIVKDDKVIADGYHQEFGGAHAEVNAINKLDTDLQDCTVYVTLEPCSHYGKTPPCAELLVKKNPKRVVIAMEDPNPIVSGNGISILKAAGIEVQTGVLEKEARELNSAFVTNMAEKRPFITAKFAMSLDGFVAEPNHESKWISCEESRKDVHKLRAEVDAVLVGSGTVRYDNPELTVRLVEGRNPKRVVFTNHLLIPFKSHILDDEFATQNTIIFCSNDAQNIKLLDQLRQKGIGVDAISKGKDGKIDIRIALTKLLNEHQIGHILLEGGSKLFSSFLAEDLIDELIVYQSPKILGTGISPFASLKPQSLADANKFDLQQVTKVGADAKSVWRRVPAS
jgi:diaminohydroxyphosphoribosylaminopyrimidine deaminase/5-amino-6-(5-phosphoribosylamino)uracil reductase